MLMQKKSVRKRMLNILMMCGVTIISLLAPSQEVQAKASIGSVELYKTENVKSDGTGDYILEIKLINGWKPYSVLEVGVGAGTLCTAYDKGYTFGDRKNQYVLEGVKGAILEDIDNDGYFFRGKVTNPINGTIEVPLNLCEEHERGILVGQAYMTVIAKTDSNFYVDGHVDFKDAKPISEKGTTPTPIQPDKVYKEDVNFVIGKESYTLTTKTGEKITKTMQSGEAPYMSNGRTMIPVRYAGEALNASVEWNPSKREVIVKKNDVTVRLPLNSQYAIYSDGTKVDMGAKTMQRNGRTYVPVGALGRMLDATVTWNSKTQTATITQK